MEFINLEKIEGNFIVLENEGASYNEVVEIKINNKKKLGQVVEINKNKVIVQVLGDIQGFSLNNTSVRFLVCLMEIKLSEEILGRVFNGLGEPIDGLGGIYFECKKNINGSAINPVSRVYPRNYIQTGISSIDGLATLIRGQKLPIFSGNGLPHDKLAAQIVRQASLGNDLNEKFGIVFVAMGVKYDVAEYFKKGIEENGVMERVVMILN